MTRSRSRPLRVGLNALFLVEGSGGTGTYVRGLVPELLRSPDVKSLTIFVSRDVPESFLEETWAREVEWVRHDVPISDRRILLAQMAVLPAQSARRELDVLHSPANVGPLLTIRTAKVVTLLDLIWLHEGSASGIHGWARFTMRTASLACARAADRVLAISEVARRDLVATAGLDPEKIDVTPLGVNGNDEVEATGEADLRSRLQLGGSPFVLSVAQKRPYKRLDVLIRALPALNGAMLVLPGAPTDHEDELRALATDLGVQTRVRFVGWVSDADLLGLYRAATCFVLPSRMEGFGLPILEAMRQGTPVACSNRSALPEVAGGAALIFDPDDQEAVTDAVRRLLGDPSLRAELAERGERRARRFTWERTAAATVGAYHRAVEERRRRILGGILG